MLRNNSMKAPAAHSGSFFISLTRMWQATALDSLRDRGRISPTHLLRHLRCKDLMPFTQWFGLRVACHIRVKLRKNDPEFAAGAFKGNALDYTALSWILKLSSDPTFQLNFTRDIWIKLSHILLLAEYENLGRAKALSDSTIETPPIL